jgi:hypothetical protein
MMQFTENETYVDRTGNEYVYLYKIGGVVVFKSADGKRIVQHFSGRYRWDAQDHPRDIIGKK